jgi:hypothetical protein
MSLKKEIKIKLLLFLSIPFFSWFFLHTFFVGDNQKFDQLALGDTTTKVTNYVNGKPILCSSFGQLDECLNYLKNKSFNKKILWIGNSQLDSVNQGKVGTTKTASHKVSKYFYDKNIGVITFAAPNISFQEYSVVIEYSKKKIDLDMIILPLVFDDTREDGIRKSFLFNKEKNKNVQKTLQEIFESKIILYLDKQIKWNQIRSAAQGKIYTFLYQSRNLVFNIQPTSTRKSIKPIFDKNILSLEKILKKLKKENIKTILYVAPLRNDIQIPYSEVEYSHFKRFTENLSTKHSSYFYNLENIVPGFLWGEKPGTKIGVDKEVDFMHFKEQGHAILGKKIISLLDKLL